MWEGRTVAILASGPSMSAEVAAQVRAASVPTVTINDTHRLAPWADMLYACDATWWNHHSESALKFERLKVTCDPSVQFPAVLLVTQSGRSGFDPDPSKLRTGRNSGYQSTHIAMHAGAKKIVLCGFDMRGDHWFGKHSAPLIESNEHVHRDLFIPEFEKLAPIARGLGIDIVNCTPGSAMTCFRMGDLTEELANT